MKETGHSLSHSENVVVEFADAGVGGFSESVKRICRVMWSARIRVGSSTLDVNLASFDTIAAYWRMNAS